MGTATGEEPDLFTFALTRRTDPTTSFEAARSVDHAIPELEARVLAHLRSRGPQTSEEIAAALGMDRVTISPRLRPLANKGLATDSGQRRPGASGRPAIVWQAT